MHDIASFLQGFPPFASASADRLDEVARATEIEFFPQGAMVLETGRSSTGNAYVVRTGQAALVCDGQVTDVLGPGDMFGLPSMLTDLPAGLDVRAAEDLLVYRIGADAMLPLLADRAGLRYLGETVRSRSGARRDESALVDEFTPSPADSARTVVIVGPGDGVETTVDRMNEADASSAVVVSGGEAVGIVTDRDLRRRVLGRGLRLDTPVSVIMSAPVRTIALGATADEAALLMLMHSIHHLPVVDDSGVVVGVVEDADLLASRERGALRLRRRIAEASSIVDLTSVAAQFTEVVAAARSRGESAERVTTTYAVLVESCLEKVIALTMADVDPPPAEFSLLTTGSVARGENVLASDLDTLMIWAGEDDDADVRAWMRHFAGRVLATMADLGFAIDPNGVRADDPRFSRSAEAWRAAVSGWAEDPTADQGDIYLSALVDAHAVVGEGLWLQVRPSIAAAVGSPLVQSTFARVCVARKPPTGFIRDFVIEATGEHRGTLDVKGGGVGLVVDIARLLSSVVGSGERATIGRIRAAREHTLIPAEDLDDLAQAFTVLLSIQLDHQVGQVRGGATPDSRIAPADLVGLTRRQLREALRVIARTQRQIDAGLARSQPR